MKSILPCFLMIFLWSCSKKKSVDLIVTNANIYTVDSTFSKAEAFAVTNGKFVDVGSLTDINTKYDADEVLNAEGKTIIPGLFDAHCHFYGLGMNQQHVNLLNTKNFDEVVQRVVDFQKAKPQKFIIGRGWDQNDWPVTSFPDNKKLNELFPDTPVVLERIDGHAYLANQKALSLAGIDEKTKIDGGEIVKEHGKLTGVLVDNPMQLIDAIIPAPTRAINAQALLDAQKICLKYGLTTINDAGLDKNIIELMDSLQTEGALKIRIYAMVRNTKPNLAYYLEKGIYKTDRLDVRAVKVYADGALGSRGAVLKEAYSDAPGHFGAMVTPVAEIDSLAMRLAKTDFQMNTHAIGDSANAVVLRAYKTALKGDTTRRWKVEHAQILTGNDFDYFKLGIIPSVQPTHATSDMYWAKNRLGAKRMKGAYAYKKLLDEAGIIALGTDFPVEKVNPFLTFYAAVARQDTTGYPKNGFQKENALTREETLKGMTIWAAYSNFEEKEKGSIAPGKFADFVILSDDIMKIPIHKVPHVKAEKTFINGALVAAQ